MELLRELYEVSQPTRTRGYFQISSSIDNVKYAFLYNLKESYHNANGSRHEETTPYKMNTFELDNSSLSNCRI